MSELERLRQEFKFRESFARLFNELVFDAATAREFWEHCAYFYDLLTDTDLNWPKKRAESE